MVFPDVHDNGWSQGSGGVHAASCVRGLNKKKNNFWSKQSKDPVRWPWWPSHPKNQVTIREQLSVRVAIQAVTDMKSTFSRCRANALQNRKFFQVTVVREKREQDSLSFPEEFFCFFLHLRCPSFRQHWKWPPFIPAHFLCPKTATEPRCSVVNLFPQETPLSFNALGWKTEVVPRFGDSDWMQRNFRCSAGYSLHKYRFEFSERQQEICLPWGAL